MADNNEGSTESPKKTVEPQIDLDQESLASLLKTTLERDEQPEPQPANAEEQSEESEPSDEASVSAEGEADNDLSKTETTEAEAEPAANEAEDEQDGLAPDVQESVNKRIGKEVRKRKEAEESAAEEVAELKQKLAEAEARAAEVGEPVAPPPTDENPFANLQTAEDVQKELLRAEQTLEWAEDNPDGAYITTKEGEQEFTQEDVREIRKKAARAIRRQLPDQMKFIQTRESLEPDVLKAYPWWKDKASSEYQNAQMAIREFPELMTKPNYKLIVGDALVGQAVRLTQGKKPAPVKATPKAPSQPTAPAAEPAPVDPKAARSASARKSFQETGGVDELAEIIKLNL